MKTDTPRTDEQHAQFQMGGFTLDFARQLERELAAARAEMHKSIEERREESMKATAARSGLEMWKRCSQKAEQELVTVTEQRDRLAEALKELLTTGDNGYGTPTDKAWEMAEQAFAAVKGGADE